MVEWLFDNSYGAFRCSECTCLVENPSPFCPYCGEDMGLRVYKEDPYCDVCATGCEVEKGKPCPIRLWGSWKRYRKWYKDESLCLSCKHNEKCGSDDIGFCDDYEIK